MDQNTTPQTEADLVAALEESLSTALGNSEDRPGLAALLSDLEASAAVDAYDNADKSDWPVRNYDLRIRVRASWPQHPESFNATNPDEDRAYVKAMVEEHVRNHGFITEGLDSSVEVTIESHDTQP